MNPTLATLSSPSSSFLRLKTRFSLPPPSSTRLNPHPLPSLSVRASSNPTPNLKSFANTVILLGATTLMIGKFSQFPAKAESPVTVTEQTSILEENTQEQETASPLSDFLESNTEAIEALKSVLQQKLESGEDEETLNILNQLVSLQPEVMEWKFLLARLLSEMGQTENARNVFEEILDRNPLSFEALFENALLMERCGDGEAVMRRLEEALSIAQDENKVKEARDVRLIIAQILFLQKNVEEALKSYQELAREDPSDFRPYFCQGMIYSLLDQNEEAKEQFAKYRELSPKKFEVEGYLRTPLSRIKLFGTNDSIS
ncbi:hypothetical protein SLE2022_232680 [Rubroshorea leprosula]